MRISGCRQEPQFSSLYNRSRMLAEYYNAARHAAALAEKDWFGVLKLTGSGTRVVAPGMVTNDVQKLAPGAGCYAAHLTPQGKIVAHMHILADEDALWLSLERTALPKLVRPLRQASHYGRCADRGLFGSIRIFSGCRAEVRVAVLEAWLGESLDA